MGGGRVGARGGGWGVGELLTTAWPVTFNVMPKYPCVFFRFQRTVNRELHFCLHHIVEYNCWGTWGGGVGVGWE